MVGHAGIGALAIAGVVVLAQWMVAARASCPLCFGPVLGCKKCAMHNKAEKLLGSYRLRVATDITFSNTFRCPYCGEPTLLELRRKSGVLTPRGVDRPQRMG